MSFGYTVHINYPPGNLQLVVILCSGDLFYSAACTEIYIFTYTYNSKYKFKLRHRFN